MKTEYKTEVYNANKTFFYLIIVFILIILLLIFLGIWLKIPLVSVAGFICLCVLPFIFEKKIKKSFTKRILLEFTDSTFSVTTYQSNDDIVSKQSQIKWSEIKSYKVYFSLAKNTILYLYLRDGTFKSWNFKDNKTFDEAIKDESIFKVFSSFINKFNTNNSNDVKIALNMGFLNSKTGTFVLYSEIVIIVAGFIFHIIMHPPSSFLTFLMGFSIILQQLIKRKQERVIYDKINTLA